MIGHIAVAVGHTKDETGQSVLSHTIKVSEPEILKLVLCFGMQ